MADRDTYLFYTLSDDTYTNNFSIDITASEKIFKNAILSRAHPIIHMDVMPGNFVLNFNGEGTQLFKVITVKDTCFTVAHENSEIIVFYEKQEYLECICPDLRTTFTHKLSKRDIMFVINLVKESIDDYNRVAYTLTTETSISVKKPNITRSTSIDLQITEEPIITQVSSSRITLSKSPFAQRINEYVRNADVYLGTDVFVATNLGEPKKFVRRLSDVESSISIKPEAIVKNRKNIHWIFRLITCDC